MIARWPIASFVVLSACSPAALSVVQVPFAEATRSAIVAVERPGVSAGQDPILALRAVSVSAGRATEGLPLSASFDTDVELLVVALEYTETLEDLDVGAGPIARVGSGGASRALPDAATRSSARVRDGEVSAFAPYPGADPILDAVRIAARRVDPTACPDFEISSVVLPIRENGQYALPLEGGGALIVTRGSKAFVVSPDQTWQALPVGADFPDQSAYTDAAGVTWLGGRGGALWRARVTTGIADLELVSTSTVIGDLNAVSAGAVGAGVEVYALSRSGRIARYDGARWHRVGDYPVATEGAIAWVGPGSGHAVLGSLNAIIRLRSDGAELERPVSSARGYTAIGAIPGFGLVAAGDFEGLYQLDGGGWRLLPASEHNMTVRAMVPLDGGVFVAGDIGQGAYYQRDRGICPPRQLSDEPITFGVPYAGGLLLGGDHRNGTIFLKYLRRVR